MLLRIFTIMVVCTLIIFLIFWLITGGFSRGLKAAQNFTNPLDLFRGAATGTAIKLPWQPDIDTSYGANLDTGFLDGTTDDSRSNPANVSSGSGNTASTQDTLVDLQNQYNDLTTQAQEARTFGSPSPHRGEVLFDGYETNVEIPAHEFIRLQSGYNSTAPISLTGWSLQSLVTGIRVPIPPAAPAFVSGSLNNVAPITLNPGGSVTITSGVSPVGVSFQENICTGYLAELQEFYPALDMNCPNPGDFMSVTPENIQIYGESCIDYMRSIEPCHFPGKDASQTVSPTCRNFATNQLTYNGCVYSHRNEAGFTSPSWRVYLASTVKLWRPAHDIIRLLDEQGRTVDVLTY